MPQPSTVSFTLTFKLKSKYREGPRVDKQDELPETPYRRLLAQDNIAPETKEMLRQQMESLDPVLRLKHIRDAQDTSLDKPKPFGYGNHMATNGRRQRDAVFRAISDPTRREILGILRGGHQTVGGIAGNFRMSRPAISKHLRLLHAAGLVVTEKRGTANVCRLDAKPLRLIDDWLHDYEVFWSESLKSLKKYMEE